MIRRHDHRPARLFQRNQRPTQAQVDRLTRLDGRRQTAGMAHHVRVGIIDHDQVIALFDGQNQLVRHLDRGHLGLQIIGRDRWRFRHEAVLARKGHLAATVQEKGDMGVFLGLGQPELAAPLCRHPFANAVGQDALWPGRRHIGAVAVGILDHPQERRPFRTRSRRKPAERRIGHCRQYLARPVRAEVQAKESVAILGTGIVANDHRGHEFIHFTLGIGRGHGGLRGRRRLALGFDHRAVGPLDPLPAVVAVHRPIAPDHRGDPCPLGQRHHQRRDKLLGRVRRHVAPIGDGMQRHRNPGCGDRTGSRQHMVQMPMHPAVRDHAHQMRHATTGLQGGDKGQQTRILRERAILDRQINRPQIHRHHPPRADVGVTDLGIAHLPGRQADIGAEGGQSGAGAGSPKTIEIGHIGQRRG